MLLYCQVDAEIIALTDMFVGEISSVSNKAVGMDKPTNLEPTTLVT